MRLNEYRYGTIADVADTMSYTNNINQDELIAVVINLAEQLVSLGKIVDEQRKQLQRLDRVVTDLTKDPI